MIVIIVGFTLGGRELDKNNNIDFPVFTLILSLVGIFIALYTAIKEFTK